MIPGRKRRAILPYRIVAIGLSLLLYASCRGKALPAPTPPPTTLPTTLLNVGLSDNAAALAQPWARAYRAETEQALVNLVVGNNAALFDDLDDEQLDAILVHHIPEERGEYWFNPVALDGLVIVVHPDNPATSLTQAQLQTLFSGETGNWSGVGGLDLPVTPYGQERGDGARTVFTRRVMGARPVSINTVVQSNSATLLEAVAAGPGAIGYTMLSALDGGASTRNVKAVAIDGIAPTPENTATQTYALTVPLYYVAKGEPQGELRTFLAWLQSAEGQSIVSEIVGSVR